MPEAELLPQVGSSWFSLGVGLGLGSFVHIVVVRAGQSLGSAQLVEWKHNIVRIITQIFANMCLELFADTTVKNDDRMRFHDQLGKCLHLGDGKPRP